MLSALIVDDDATVSGDVRRALADAGCVDIDSAPHEQALALLQSGARSPSLVVVNLAGSDLQWLQRLARAAVDVPFVAICEDQHVDAVLFAGAEDCVTTPLSSRELFGRVRAALRNRDAVPQRTQRERRMSDAIAALTREKEDLERLVCVDALTGVANRPYALSLLESEWRRSAREQAPLGLVMVDLDSFHAYNEHYGHLGGDACLRLVSEAMVKCLRRPSDFLGRYGGEEFVAVLPNTDAAGARIVAERLRLAVESLAIAHVGSTCAPVVTITAGFGSLRATSDQTVTGLIELADDALFRAKSAGRNRVGGDAPISQPSRVSAQRWQRFQPVVSDPWFADRIPRFLAEANDGATAITQALRANDLVRIKRIAATLKAGARTLRLLVVERLVENLEHAAIASDVTAARDASDELVQYVTHVQVVYRRDAGTLSLVATSL